MPSPLLNYSSVMNHKKLFPFLSILAFALTASLMLSALTQSTISYSGVAAGDATSSSAMLWTRTVDTTTNQGKIANLTVQLSTDPQFHSILSSFSGVTDPQRDYTLKIEATGLKSGTRYYYRFQSANGFSPVGSFKTAPETTEKVAVRFGFSGDADGKWRPYPSTQDFQKLNLDFFVFLGDIMYETKSALSEATADPFANPTQALADYHRKYRENLEPVKPGGFSSLQTLYAAQANYSLLDNHELGNKQFQNGGAPAGTPPGKGGDATQAVNNTDTFINKTDGFKVLMQAYRDYQPIREKMIVAPQEPRTNDTLQLYFSQQWGANCIFINVDDRSYRDIRLKTATGEDDTGAGADKPQRMMLDATQFNWLKQTLLAAQKQGTTWKIVAVSSPIDEGSEDSGKSWIGGYRAQRRELLKFIADNRILNVVFLSTDDHQNRVNELTYLENPQDPQSRRIVPQTFTIVGGPIGASGPDKITNHQFISLKALVDLVAASQKAKGLNPLGLDPQFPGLQNVFREGDPQADRLRQPIDFTSPDTFNYVTLEISADGSTLSVDTFGINSYAADTFPEPQAVGPIRKILGFQVKAQ